MNGFPPKTTEYLKTLNKDLPERTRDDGYQSQRARSDRLFKCPQFITT